MASEAGSDKGGERRKFPRLSQQCRIRVRPLSGVSLVGDGLEGVTVNISGGGLCFNAESLLEKGAFVAVELSLAEFPSPVLALARVAFAASSGPPFETGLEFWWVGWGDDSAQRAIGDFIKTELEDRDPS